MCRDPEQPRSQCDSRHRHDPAEPRHARAVLKEFLRLTPLVRAEAGCLEYGATVDRTDLECDARAGRRGCRGSHREVGERRCTPSSLASTAHGRLPRPSQGLREGRSAFRDASGWSDFRPRAGTILRGLPILPRPDDSSVRDAQGNRRKPPNTSLSRKPPAPQVVPRFPPGRRVATRTACQDGIGFDSQALSHGRPMFTSLLLTAAHRRPTAGQLLPAGALPAITAVGQPAITLPGPPCPFFGTILPRKGQRRQEGRGREEGRAAAADQVPARKDPRRDSPRQRPHQPRHHGLRLDRYVLQREHGEQD